MSAFLGTCAIPSHERWKPKSSPFPLPSSPTASTRLLLPPLFPRPSSPTLLLPAGALSAVSLPTHVTGYFLSTIPRTAILWGCVAVGMTYGVLAVVCFFTVLEESTAERYRAPIDVAADDTRKSMGRLRWMSRAAAVVAVLYVGLSVALFALGLQYSASEWNEWWSVRVPLFFPPSSVLPNFFSHPRRPRRPRHPPLPPHVLHSHLSLS
jgi:hypothetical protein